MYPVWERIKELKNLECLNGNGPMDHVFENIRIKEFRMPKRKWTVPKWQTAVEVACKGEFRYWSELNAENEFLVPLQALNFFKNSFPNWFDAGVRFETKTSFYCHPVAEPIRKTFLNPYKTGSLPTPVKPAIHFSLSPFWSEFKIWKSVPNTYLQPVWSELGDCRSHRGKLTKQIEISDFKSPKKTEIAKNIEIEAAISNRLIHMPEFFLWKELS